MQLSFYHFLQTRQKWVFCIENQVERMKLNALPVFLENIISYLNLIIQKLPAVLKLNAVSLQT